MAVPVVSQKITASAIFAQNNLYLGHNIATTVDIHFHRSRSCHRLVRYLGRAEVHMPQSLYDIAARHTAHQTGCCHAATNSESTPAVRHTPLIPAAILHIFQFNALL